MPVLHVPVMPSPNRRVQPRVTTDWISATGISVVVVISWVGSPVGVELAEETHDAVHTAVTVSVEVGTD